MGRSASPVSWDPPREATEEEVAVNHGLWRQCFTAFVVSLTTLNSGLATLWLAPGVELTAGAYVPGRLSEYSPSDDMVPSHCAAILSALLMGTVANFYGRKTALCLAAVINIIGGGILKSANGSTNVLAGRACASCAIVSGLLVGPMLLSETTHWKIRGALITFCTIPFNLGMMAAYSFRPSSTTRNIFQIVYIVIPAVQLIICYFVPESPYFLVSKSRTLEAEGSIFWSRGSNRPIAKGELGILVRSPLFNHNLAFLSTIKSQRTIKALLTSTGLVVFQRMSGSLVFFTYSEYIFHARNYAELILTGVLIAVSVLSTCFVDMIGRKKLLYVSYFGSFLTLLVMTVYLVTQKVNKDEEWNCLPLVCLICFTVFHNVGSAPLTSVIPNEISPVRVKGVVASIDGVLTSVLVLGVLAYIPVLRRHVGDYMNFLIPTLMNLMALVFTWAVVPETKCRPLLECSEKYEKGSNPELLKLEVTNL